MTNEMNLQEVLEEYAIAAGTENDHQILRQMSHKYPQYAEDLQDFAAARAVLKYAPHAELSADDEAKHREIGRQNLRTILSELNAAPQPALASLTDAAKAKGLNRAKFAAAAGLSVSLIQYLEKRRLDFVSIPKAIISKVADVLETNAESVANYLNQSPVSTANASFKTDTRPEESAPKSFSDAVREDQQLSGDEKKNLLEI